METRLEQNKANIKRVILAWCVHFYTALGLVLAAGMAVSIVRGTPESFRFALLLMLIATFIDSTDGWLARRAKVKEVLPGFDGRRLDDLVDFQTYTSLPLLLLWRAEVLPQEYAWLLFLPLLASAYGFSQTNAKTDDGFFLGFPSYWNVIAFYLYFLRVPLWTNALVLVGFSILTFVPTIYLYPSQRAPFSKLTNVLASLWAALLVYIILVHPENARTLVWISLTFPAYYVIVSWFLTIQRKRPQA
jgi:phosphatidylcholine synthase